VIPLFVQQIKEGKPLTITDPEMTRFLMSLEDSVDLVLYAYEHGVSGDTFVQKAPASTILDLALALKQIFNANNEIKLIGTRHGEKLFESLVNREEMAKAIEHDRYFRIPTDSRDLNYNQYFIEGDQRIAQAEEYTSHNTERLDVVGTVQLLLKLDYIQDALKS
jgi:UDP-glucose 4-epimerase